MLVNIAFVIFYQIHVSLKKKPALWKILIKSLKVLLPISASLMRRQWSDIVITDHVCEFAVRGRERDARRPHDAWYNIHIYTYIQGVVQLPTIIQIAHVLSKNQSFFNGNVKDDLITNRTSKIKELGTTN